MRLEVENLIEQLQKQPYKPITSQLTMKLFVEIVGRFLGHAWDVVGVCLRGFLDSARGGCWAFNTYSKPIQKMQTY